MNFTLLSAMEFPGYGISYFGMQYWGRKVRLTIYFLLSRKVLPFIHFSWVWNIILWYAVLRKEGKTYHLFLTKYVIPFT